MEKQYVIPFVIMLVVGITGCASHTVDKAWPEPRPLGKEISTYHPPHEKSTTPLVTPKLDEPKGVVTLGQALSLALKNNPELAALSWEVRTGEAKTLQASLYTNPEIEVEVENFGGSREGEENPDGTVDKNRRFDGAETTITLSQLIELGGKRSKRKQVAAIERDLLGWDYEAKRLDIITEVRKAFIDLLAMQERLSLMENLVQLSGKVYTTVSERVKAGKVSPVEETKAKVALLIIRIEQERVRRDLEVARKRLAGTWGSTSPVFQKVKGDLEAITSIPPFEDLINRVSQNPDIARWTTEYKQRQAALDEEKTNRLPDLTIGGGVRYLDESEDQTFIMGLSIPLPLLDRNQGGVLEARYRIDKAKEESNVVEVTVATALHEAYQVLSTAFVEVSTLSNDVLSGAQSAFDAENEGYREGKFGYLDVLDAQRTLFDVKGQYIEALARYHNAVATVERLIGESLDSVQSNVQQK
jgi:cobalt-zinc-cadmium efflux system outer membrane protein